MLVTVTLPLFSVKVSSGRVGLPLSPPVPVVVPLNVLALALAVVLRVLPLRDVLPAFLGRIVFLSVILVSGILVALDPTL